MQLTTKHTNNSSITWIMPNQNAYYYNIELMHDLEDHEIWYHWQDSTICSWYKSICSGLTALMSDNFQNIFENSWTNLWGLNIVYQLTDDVAIASVSWTGFPISNSPWFQTNSKISVYSNSLHWIAAFLCKLMVFLHFTTQNMVYMI